MIYPPFLYLGCYFILTSLYLWIKRQTPRIFNCLDTSDQDSLGIGAFQSLGTTYTANFWKVPSPPPITSLTYTPCSSHTELYRSTKPFSLTIDLLLPLPASLSPPFLSQFSILQISPQRCFP